MAVASMHPAAEHNPVNPPFPVQHKEPVQSEFTVHAAPAPAEPEVDVFRTSIAAIPTLAASRRFQDVPIV